MFHGSANSVFVTNNKKYMNCLKSSASASNLGVRLCDYSYVVSFLHMRWSQFPRGHNRRRHFLVLTTVCSWCERPSTCSSPEVLGLSWASNFLSSLRTGSPRSTPCSPSCHSLSISKIVFIYLCLHIISSIIAHLY